ncbi:hypothetical protein [Streptomyces sp. NPDC002402]
MLAGLTLPVVASSPAWPATVEKAYVANFGSDNVSVIDTATNSITATVTVGHTAAGPHRHTFGGLSDAAFRLIPLLESGQDSNWPWE